MGALWYRVRLFMIKVSVMYITIGAENLILLRAHKTRDRPPVIPTATSLGIKIKIFMIKVRKFLHVPVLIIGRFVGGNKHQNFKY
jgi:hypothetical protein